VFLKQRQVLVDALLPKLNRNPGRVGNSGFKVLNLYKQLTVLGEVACLEHHARTFTNPVFLLAETGAEHFESTDLR
jgi:hypothetical protein